MHSFSDHSSQLEMKNSTHGVLDLSCFMDDEHPCPSYFQKEACLTSFCVNFYTDLISLIVSRASRSGLQNESNRNKGWHRAREHTP